MAIFLKLVIAKEVYAFLNVFIVAVYVYFVFNHQAYAFFAKLLSIKLNEEFLEITNACAKWNRVALIVVEFI